EGDAQLLALIHRDDVERRPIEDDVEPLPRRIGLDAKPVEPARFRRGTRRRSWRGRGCFGCGRRRRRVPRRGIVFCDASRGLGHGLAPVFGAAAAFRRRGFGSSVGRFGFHACGQCSLAASSRKRRGAVNGSSKSPTPTASATALAMHTGVLIEFPSATPLAPSGVTGESVSRCNTTRSGTMPVVGTA